MSQLMRSVAARLSMTPTQNMKPSLTPSPCVNVLSLTFPASNSAAQRVVFGSDYEDGQRVYFSAPSSACARPDRPSGF